MTDVGPRTPQFTNGQVSYWHRTSGFSVPREPLPGDRSFDVAIVGGGYTGLWTAYYLKRAQPDMRVAILEAEFAGFGASGRNAGWLSAEPPGQLRRYAESRGWPATIALQRAMFGTIDEVIDVTAREGIDAGIVRDGVLRVATNAAQEVRLRGRVTALRKSGWGEDDLLELSRAEVLDRIRIQGVRAADWSPHGARIQPALLARGLARAVESLGVDIFEGTTVLEVRPGTAVTDRGTVQADHVIRATEGFTPTLKGLRRSMLPMNSSMIITAQLSDRQWEEIGWQSAVLVGDGAHMFCYMQRTADGRIVVGGRGVPYRFRSRTDDRGQTHVATMKQLRGMLRRYFPAAGDVSIDHAWSGVLGVPRDWCASVRHDPSTGLGSAGGYVGHGVAGTNLAGRTLRDLILRRDTQLTRLPWVNRKSATWEPEPLRWLGVRGLHVAYAAADAQEFGGGARTSTIARIADRIGGR